MAPTPTMLSSRTAKPIRDLIAHVREEVPALRFAPAGMTSFRVGCIYKWVSSRTAQPIRDLVPHRREGVPALRFAPAGMTSFLEGF
ncbi:hypothetical protein PbB2_03136 [Candidatus Phycosocius bacilliformis]|uniref:Uncharacterized protein n=1 Tax=Candidatus Phycosocius bacilliformis TaxID=1445552 RepID=A0A2P2EEF1_9PROT|nr:hypothetical protein PbB2_03136 [Candidatus Phycosocius bacilliformis]